MVIGGFGDRETGFPSTGRASLQDLRVLPGCSQRLSVGMGDKLPLSKA